jgi:hypothetical protein
MKTSSKPSVGILRISSLLLLAGFGAATSSAATIISESFSGTSLPSTLEATGLTSNITFDGSTANFGGFADSGRAYLRTVDKNFFSQSFTAEVTLQTGGHISFFGMGNGSNSPFAMSYEPIGPSINLRLHPSSIVSGRTDAVGTNGTGFTQVDSFANVGSQPNQRLQLTWDAVAKTAVFAVDYGYSGTFFADATSGVINGSALGLSDSNTSIFFGGSNGATFDNFIVTTPASSNVPDAASTLVLLSLGLLFSLKFRRSFAR